MLSNGAMKPSNKPNLRLSFLIVTASRFFQVWSLERNWSDQIVQGLHLQNYAPEPRHLYPSPYQSLQIVRSASNIFFHSDHCVPQNLLRISHRPAGRSSSL